MYELRFPYNMVRDNLEAALAKLDMPRKDAIDWQLVYMLQKANQLLENEYFQHPLLNIETL